MRPFLLSFLFVMSMLGGCLEEQQIIIEDCTFESSSSQSDTLYILSYDILAFDEALIDEFENRSGYTVEFILADDAGGILNTMMLMKDQPQADLVIGLDNTYIQTAIDFCLIEPITIDVEHIQPELMTTYSEYGVPFDYGHVCLNADTSVFDANLESPTSLNNLTSPDWKGKVAFPSPLTSSPGRAFFLATLGYFNHDIDQTLEWWNNMKNNDLILTSGWTESYEIHYSGGYGIWTEGHIGDAAITVSYCHSPGVEAYFSENQTSSRAILFDEVSFKQIEYVSFTNGKTNRIAAESFTEFLLSYDVNQHMPTSNYMYSVLQNTSLPVDSGYLWNSPIPSNSSHFDMTSTNSSIDDLLVLWSEVMLS